MKKYVEVFWTPWVRVKNFEDFAPHQILFHEPLPLLKELSNERMGTPVYMRCPAFVAICKNSFLVRSPLSMNITINPDRTISTDRFGQYFFDSNIIPRFNQTAPSNPALMSGFPDYLFYANEPVEMEMVDPILLNGAVSRNVKLVPGSFDISKWIRPIQYSFEVIDPDKPLEFRVGDPLFVVRFRTKNDRPVKLIRTVQDEHLNFAVQACVGLKDFRPHLTLAKMYEVAGNFLKLWKSKRK